MTIGFVDFCTQVLGLTMSDAWRVLLSVSIDCVDPRTLTGTDADLARTLFGDIDGEITDVARKTHVWRCGRGSGKTTFSAALGVWSMFVGDCSGVGPGMVPTVIVVSPSLPASKRATAVARELIRASKLERYIVKSQDAVEGFSCRRPDGRRVAFMSAAASRGGHTLRGFDCLMIILDESEFFNSSGEIASGESHVSDKDLLAAVSPRLLGSAVLISTPWPAPNMTAELVEANHGTPDTALVAIGPSTTMRPDDKKLSDRVALELKRNNESARREFFCEAIEGGGRFFDMAAVERAITKRPPEPSKEGTIVAACDLGFVKDHSVLVLLERRADGVLVVVEVDSVRPTKGSPIQPSVLFARWAPILAAHQVRVVHSDSFNAASVRELCQSHGLHLNVINETRDTKASRYIALRDTIARDGILLPNDKRLIDGMRGVVGKALPGGSMAVTAHRRSGAGHSDAVSALVLAHYAMSVSVNATNLHEAFIDWNQRLKAAGAGQHWGGIRDSGGPTLPFGIPYSTKARPY